ncbi:MAG TPA: cysteine hydrolase family protein [Candidatus Limnocylindrales bacterium]|nr:cysteine hydrolase family protein [Candidatus Limnocylindrales bacterium]
MTPPFYLPEQVGQLYAPNAAAAVSAGRQAGMKPSSTDRQRTLLLLVDAQVDFIHTDGALSVPGAVDDTRRTIEWLCRNAGEVTTIAASLDSHVPIQIFFPTWWVDDAGQHPEPYTTITSHEVDRRRWRPLYEPEWSQEYVERLEHDSRKELMIWPYHVLIGTVGHSFSPALYEAVAFHTAARQSQPIFLAKGSIPKTEHYSILEPEVKVPEAPLGSLNIGFLSMIATYDRIYIAGQAKSHCVLETVASMMRYFKDRPDTISKIRVLMDCTSSVAHPEIDFDVMADEALAVYAERGLTLANSTDELK